MQQFIYILQLQPQYRITKNWTDETNRIVGEHFNYLKNLNEKGIALLVGKSEYDNDHPDNFGICIFHAENMDDARALMNNDPCIVNGVMYAELHPFRVVLQ